MQIAAKKRTLVPDRRETGADKVWTASFVGLVIFTLAIVTIRFNVAEIGIGIAALGIALSTERFRFPVFLWLYLLYLVWALLSSLVSNYLDTAIDTLEEGLKLLLMMVVAVNALRRPAQIRIYIIMILLFFLIYPFRGAVINYFIGYTVFGRAIWNYTYSNPNDLAGLTLLALGIALSLGLSADKSRIVRMAYLFAAIALGVLVLLTQSRGAFIGMAIGLGIPLFRVAWKARGTTLILFASAVLLFAFVPDKVWQRLAGISKLTSTETINEADPEGSAEQRFEIVKVAWQITLDHPFLGTGLASFPLAQYDYAPELGRRDAHNTYLTLSSELGVPGLLIWIACMVYALRGKHGSVGAEVGSSLGFEPKWIRYGFYSFLIAGAFGSYSRLNLLYIVLATCWCANEVVSVRPSPVSRRRGISRAESVK